MVSQHHVFNEVCQVTAKRALSTVSQRSQDHSPSFNPTLLVGSLLAASGLTATAEAEARDDSRPSAEDAQSDEVIVNWSNTHECRPKNFYQPESLQELEKIVATAHESGEKLRPIGSALSPNGLAFSNNSLVNLAFLDKVLAVDTEKRQVTVQAGARVSQVTEALRHHDVVLQNFASIAEQQIGGFTQVGAHGTGASIPPVDMQVVSLKLVTPFAGTITLSEDLNPHLFNLAKAGCSSIHYASQRSR
ncbi:hypothetical protein CYMTET_36046 [Cymbomonas tetramitiformis]|uniref:FAD-binding PCMH-type domain-containing protein n=1 Tax=Cymbomonas tetramitiformis TaxID=36881 RepID=A0AAE0F808_9CHLO|nr:hypothetical protein CYMTET_36046 [Cymbomonas tetramitiformis]